MNDFTPQNEMGVISLFSEIQSLSGYTIVEIGSTYPDAIIENGGVTYRVEFEFRSQNFITHGHDPRMCDLVICWENDLKCDDFPLPVLEMINPDWYKSSFELASVYAKDAFYWKGRALRAELALEKARVELIEKARVELIEKARVESTAPVEKFTIHDPGLNDDIEYKKLPNEYPSQESRSYLRKLYAKLKTERRVLKAAWGGVVSVDGRTPKTARWLKEALTQELQN